MTEKRQNPACILIILSGLGFSISVTLAIVKNEEPLMLSEFVFNPEVASHSIHRWMERSLKTEKHILGDDRVKTFFGFQGYKIIWQSLGCTNSKNSWCLMRSYLMHMHVWICMGTHVCRCMCPGLMSDTFLDGSPFSYWSRVLLWNRSSPIPANPAGHRISLSLLPLCWDYRRL